MRDEFLYDGDRSHVGHFTEAHVFGVSSIEGRALGFHALLSNGACWWRLPVHALVARPELPEPDLPLDWLQLWDCFSYHVAVTEFGWLAEQRCRTVLKDGQWYGGEYVLTFDWAESATAEGAGESGHKCAHMVQLDNGQYALQPDNRMQFFEPATIVPFDRPPRYKTNTRVWKVEQGSKWRTSDDDLMFYGIEQV